MRGDPAPDLKFLPGVPGAKLLARYAAAPGNEVASGKIGSPESSSFLVANALGYFLDRPADLPPLPGLEAGTPLRVDCETEIRFPWRGGRHPWLDAVIETPTMLIGVESKRYEPYRGHGALAFADTYLRPVWGENMRRYSALRDAIRADPRLWRHLDAAQLVKHAYALRTQIQRDGGVKTATLLYLFAEPESFAAGTRIPDSKRAAHRAEIARFAEAVAGDEVRFVALGYRDLLASWSASPKADIQCHARQVAAHFAV